MSLQDYARVIRERWKAVLACVVLGLVGAGLFAFLRPPEYTANLTFFATAHTGDSTTDAYQGGLLSEQRVKSYVKLLAGHEVATELIRELGLQESPEAVASKIHATTSLDTVLIEVEVVDSSPGEAARLAAGLANVFPELVNEWEQPLVPNSAPPVAVRIVQPISPGVSSSSLPLSLVLGGGLVGGLALGVVVAFALNGFDRRLRSQDAVRSLTGAEILMSVPFDSTAPGRPITATDDQSARAEAYRSIASTIGSAKHLRGRRALLVAGSVPAEGATTTLCNTGVALAESGMRVLVLDADSRDPKVADYFGLWPETGLTDVLAGQVPLERAIQPWRSDGAVALDIVVSGSAVPNPHALLTSGRMRRLLESVKDYYDVILVDAPPVLAGSDTAGIASLCDGVIMACRLGQTRQEQLDRASDALHAVSADIVGVIVTMASERQPVRYAARQVRPGTAHGDNTQRGQRETAGQAISALSASGPRERDTQSIGSASGEPQLGPMMRNEHRATANEA